MYGNILLNYYYNGKYFRQNAVEKIKTHMLNNYSQKSYCLMR